MTGLRRLLREHAGAVEADLSRYHHLDLRDHWRPGPDGRPLLTLRQIAVRLRYLPADCAVQAAAGAPGWAVGDYLLADVVHVLSGKPHPSRPSAPAAQGRRSDPARRRARNAALARKTARERAIAQGAIT